MLVKEIRKGIDCTDMKKLAASIIRCLGSITSSLWWASAPISNVKDLATSFKEAQIAMEVSKVFDSRKADHPL